VGTDDATVGLRMKKKTTLRLSQGAKRPVTEMTDKTAAAASPKAVQSTTEKGLNSMDNEISGLREIAGFIGGCLVDIDSGMMLASEGGSAALDLEAAAAMNADFVKAKLNTMATLGLKTNIEDIMITLGTQIHLIRPLEKNQKIFVYVALDRKVANLGRARLQLKEIEGSVKI
jgi:hypothetical protein